MKKYIAIIDSGVGGLSVLKKMTENFPNENYLYLGDNDNAPYGNKKERELKSLVFNLLSLLNGYRIKLLIVACNTLSSNVLSFIRSMCEYPVCGVFPPVEIELIKNKKVIMLSTIATANKYQHENLVIDAKIRLAEDIENNIYNLNNVPVINDHDKPLWAFDTVILGCTHYFFIKKIFFDHFNYKKVVCSEDLLKDYLLNNGLIAKSLVKYRRKRVLFLGSCSEKNRRFFIDVVKRI